MLVDTQFAPLNAKILAAVRAAGGSDVKYVINTHWHGDHTGGNEPLGKAGARDHRARQRARAHEHASSSWPHSISACRRLPPRRAPS